MKKDTPPFYTDTHNLYINKSKEEPNTLHISNKKNVFF